MRTKSKIILFVIVIFVAMMIIGYTYWQHETKGTIEETKRTVEIETDKEVDTELKEIHMQTNIKEKDVGFYLSDYERWIAECVVMGESGGESYEGQVLVAQCLLNACLKENLQPSEIRKKYKYAGWYDSPSDSVKSAVSEVFDNGYKITNEFILYFYAPKVCNSNWHETQRFVIEVGGHRFFAEWDR